MHRQQYRQSRHDSRHCKRQGKDKGRRRVIVSYLQTVEGHLDEYRAYDGEGRRLDKHTKQKFCYKAFHIPVPFHVPLALFFMHNYIIKSCICLLYYMSLIVNFSVSARFNYVSSERW